MTIESRIKLALRYTSASRIQSKSGLPSRLAYDWRYGRFEQKPNNEQIAQVAFATNTNEAWLKYGIGQPRLKELEDTKPQQADQQTYKCPAFLHDLIMDTLTWVSHSFEGGLKEIPAHVASDAMAALNFLDHAIKPKSISSTNEVFTTKTGGKSCLNQ